MKTKVAEIGQSIGLTDADVACVRAHSEMLVALLDDQIDDFYDHLLEGPMARHLAGIDVERLRRVQKAHWHGLFAEGIDDDYVRRVTRIGIAHREHRIHPQFYLRGYGRIAARLAAEIAGDAIADAAERSALVAAVLRLLTLDMSTALLGWDAALID